MLSLALSAGGHAGLIRPRTYLPGLIISAARDYGKTCRGDSCNSHES